MYITNFSNSRDTLRGGWKRSVRDSLLQIHSPADCGCSTRPVKANTEHKCQCCKFRILMQHTNARKSSTTFPGLLRGRPTDVPILQSGMAVIWKLHMNPPSGMHSLPAPNTVHLGPLHHKKAFEKTAYQTARAEERNWECGTEVPLRKKFRLHRPTCTCFQTMP